MAYPQYPIGYPYYQPYQMPQYQQQAQQQPQGMTPPTVHADIVQVSGEQEAAAFPVAAGASQMMVAKDDSMIFVKTAYANGQTNLEVYIKRPQRPVEKPVDFSLYVTREELESRLAALTAPKRATKKEQESET